MTGKTMNINEKKGIWEEKDTRSQQKRNNCYLRTSF